MPPSQKHCQQHCAAQLLLLPPPLAPLLPAVLTAQQVLPGALHFQAPGCCLALSLHLHRECHQQHLLLLLACLAAPRWIPACLHLLLLLLQHCRLCCPLDPAHYCCCQHQLLCQMMMQPCCCWCLQLHLLRLLAALQQLLLLPLLPPLLGGWLLAGVLHLLE